MSPTKYTIAICDDEKYWQNQILNCCKLLENDINFNFEYHIFSSGEDVLKYQSNIDILLLDEELPGTSGQSIKEQFEASNKNTIIIFITSHNEIVYDSFGKNVYGFITKPINQTNFNKTLKKTINKTIAAKYLTLPDSINDNITLSYRDITYMKANGSYTTIYMSDSTSHLIRKELNDLEKIITNDTLIRVHKSYIVNSYYIKKLNSDELILTTDTTVPLARRRKKQVQTKIAQNIYEKAESIWNN